MSSIVWFFSIVISCATCAFIKRTETIGPASNEKENIQFAVGVDNVSKMERHFKTASSFGQLNITARGFTANE